VGFQVDITRSRGESFAARRRGFDLAACPAQRPKIRAADKRFKPAFSGPSVTGARLRVKNQKGRGLMARIIVTTDAVDQRRMPALSPDSPVLLDERVHSVHLCDDHAAEQLIERLAWAVTDAEDLQRATA